MITACHEFVGGKSKNCGDVPRKQERVDGAVWIGKQRAQRRRHQFMTGKHGKVFDSPGLRHEDSGGHSRRGGFKPDARKHYRCVGVVCRQVERVHGRVDNFYPCAFSLGVFEAAAVRSWNAHEIAKGGQNDIGPLGQSKKFSNFAVVGDTDRAPRTA